ncbi:arsenate reductase family protein [Halomonas sp. ML-15]|uniref:arsenate reductase family protein n=1 Tax=Halomonas sp. ML-15 TaxID=2773305 RepID=UPI00174651EA|nr:arsenate reductase family protein [Halomonas sp. ML-15]MBD3894383.1 arsenate reductase family protein [Halomonas sp. ML-15]
MAPITYYHNPRCSKSREGLALLEAQGAELSVRRYLDTPLSLAELQALASRLSTPFASLVRTNEAAWKSLGLDINDRHNVLEAIAAEPRLLQRPIADDGHRALIGRPPEAMLPLLDNA